MKPAREQIEVNLEELAALLERARQEPLDEDGSEAPRRSRSLSLFDRLDRRQGHHDQPTARAVGEAEHGEDEQGSGAGRDQGPCDSIPEGERE